MTIARGDTMPSVPTKLVGSTESTDTTSDAVLGQGRVVFFAVPGAFTPTCDTSHLPGFVANIVCGAVNDHHVVRAWAERSEAFGKVEFIADGDGALADALGLSKQIPGMGKRFARFAMVLEDGIVKDLFVQDVAGVTVSGAPAVLMALQASQVNA